MPTHILPTIAEIEELTAFMPLLYADGFVPVKAWRGGTQNDQGVMTLPYPEYDDFVIAFFSVAANECWLDYGYNPEHAWKMLQDDHFIRKATLAEIKTMLTYCVRGERFSDGHWEQMIAGGHIRKLLNRLSVLGNEMLYN